jgi:hypothetical protein
MSRRSAFFTAALCLALVSPAPLLAARNIHWYQPHYMARVDQAANRLQFLSPHFAPSGWYAASTHYTLTNFTQNELGINLFFNESGVKDVPQGLLGLTSISTPYSQDSVASIAYANIEFFEIRNFNSSPTPWCVYPMGKESGNGIICVADEGYCSSGCRCAGNFGGGLRKESEHVLQHGLGADDGQGAAQASGTNRMPGS